MYFPSLNLTQRPAVLHISRKQVPQLMHSVVMLPEGFGSEAEMVS